MGQERQLQAFYKPEEIKAIAVLNFGGIGDEILFSPVLQTLAMVCPNSTITLYLEDRSQSIVPLLNGVHHAVALPIQNMSRFQVMKTLWQKLIAGSSGGNSCNPDGKTDTGDRKPYDMVLSSGSSPFIAILLALSGIRIRVGFNSGKLSQWLLTVAAPLAPAHQRTGYAAEMYAALSKSFVKSCFTTRVLSQDRRNDLLLSAAHPHLKALSQEVTAWANTLLAETPDGSSHKTILLHPGVSQVSIEKNILKSWPAEAWANLTVQLLSAGHRVLLVGGPDDAHAVAEIMKTLSAGLLPTERMACFASLYGKTTSLTQLAALITACNLLVAVDSSPMHMAVGYHVPLVAIFGPTDEKKLLPPESATVKAVTVENLPCRPCLWDKRKTSCDSPVCLQVPVESVLIAIQQLLGY